MVADSPVVADSPEATREVDTPRRRSLRVFGTIRNKIIFPFLFLTLFVTMLGTFVVTRLVAASAQDRLTNQLLETSRAAGDSIVDWEQYQLDVLRLVVFTVGVPDALREREVADLNDALVALAANQDIYLLIGLDESGTAITGVRQDEPTYETGLFAGQDMSALPMIEPVVSGQEDQFGDKYAGIVKIDEEIILLTVAPVRDDTDTLVGVVALGTPLKEILALTKTDVLADLTLYQADGHALLTTFLLAGESTLADLNISPATYEAALQNSEDSTPFQSFTLNERGYQSAFVPLQIRDDTLGVLGVSWPSTFVTTLITTNRNGMAVVFSVVAMLVVLTGYFVAQNLSAPIRRLAKTAEAVSEGDLSQQSGVRTSDEIGVLGQVFDNMTLKLDAQTQALLDAYREQEKEAAYLGAVITSAVEGTVVIARDGTITRMNPIARRILAHDRSLWVDVISGLVGEVLRVGRARRRVEMDKQWIDALAAPVITSRGEEVGVVITLHDVTEQVVTERMRTAFIMQMSHELYTPLTAFKGYTDLASMVLGDKDPQASKLLGQATGSAAVLNQMISQMLDVTSMIRGGFEVRPQPVDLAALIQEAADKQHDLVEGKDINLEVRFGQLMPYDGDGRRLQWAFEHLIKNACDYTLPGGWVNVFAGEQNGVCVVRVRDTGVGIARRDRSRLFEMFYRGYPTGPDGRMIDVRGTGLGLFIVDQVVRAHGGWVEVLSKVGVGSEFIVRLPLQEKRDGPPLPSGELMSDLLEG